jgi:tRNA(Arg) A34 adenosine deaminase TadA
MALQREDTLMRRAIELSIENVRSGRGGPFAALVVKDGEIISTGTNLVTTTCDPTAHAEVVAIRQACGKLGQFQLSGCEIYSSCEPCPMCLGAIYWARPNRVYFGNTASDAAAIGFDDSFIYQQLEVPLSERTIPMVQLLRDEALAAFREWERTSDRIPY